VVAVASESAISVPDTDSEKKFSNAVDVDETINGDAEARGKDSDPDYNDNNFITTDLLDLSKGSEFILEDENSKFFH
jgi:hypothetical protein